MKKIVSFWIVFLLAIVSAEAGKQTRIKYYLTLNTFTGSQALTACADGYHMAAIWEILDVSNLKYNTTLGFTRDDSGSGPPTNSLGWIRTGFDSSGGGTPGVENCNVWTNDSSTAGGTIVRLTPNWTAEVSGINPWLVNVRTCDVATHVWCVED